VVGKFILVQKIEAATVFAENAATQHERDIVSNCATAHSQNCRENELGSNVATHQRWEQAGVLLLFFKLFEPG